MTCQRSYKVMLVRNVSWSSIGLLLLTRYYKTGDAQMIGRGEWVTSIKSKDLKASTPSIKYEPHSDPGQKHDQWPLRVLFDDAVRQWTNATAWRCHSRLSVCWLVSRMARTTIVSLKKLLLANHYDSLHERREVLHHASLHSKDHE